MQPLTETSVFTYTVSFVCVCVYIYLRTLNHQRSLTSDRPLSVQLKSLTPQAVTTDTLLKFLVCFIDARFLLNFQYRNYAKDVYV